MQVSKETVCDSVRWYSGENLAGLRSAMYACLNANQDAPANLQILAPAACLVTMCEAVGLDAHEVITQINNAKSNLDAPFAHTVDAAKAYVRGEL